MEKVLANCLIEQRNHKDYMFWNSIQTNATLLDEEKIKFCKENKIRISISVDGPKSINDLNRLDKKGKGTFDIIEKNIQLLQDHEIRFSAIAVIHKKNFKKYGELFDFFKSRTQNFHFNPIVKSKKAFNCKDELGLSPRELEYFMKNLFIKYYYQRKPLIRIRNFNSLLPRILNTLVDENISMPIGICHESNYCHKLVTFLPNGDVGPCQRLEGYYTYGNIKEKHLNKILNTKLYHEIKNRKKKLSDDCKQCKWLELCNGGCTLESVVSSGNISGKIDSCLAYKKFFEFVSEFLEKELKTEIKPVNGNIDVNSLIKFSRKNKMMGEC